MNKALPKLHNVWPFHGTYQTRNNMCVMLFVCYKSTTTTTVHSVLYRWSVESVECAFVDCPCRAGSPVPPFPPTLRMAMVLPGCRPSGGTALAHDAGLPGIRFPWVLADSGLNGARRWYWGLPHANNADAPLSWTANWALHDVTWLCSDVCTT